MSAPWRVITDDPNQAMILSADLETYIAIVAAGPFYDQILKAILDLEPKDQPMPKGKLPAHDDPFWQTPKGAAVQAQLTDVYTKLHPGLGAVPWAQILAAIEAILQILGPILFPPTPAPTP